ncbi:sirohydrochlorin cobaltochelatase [Mobilisporobacter senegalensis]|uniref:Sirohydrochlorin cobaltochelatase n=1 Tax=Mobilisporobacter senegalensis TaxID=1329262 RepID=A0A3N1XT34_9FIRM|nr:sirohydrochlorin cobaltochelatase [Mobilisporobacter senegalensis]ROR28322.1 sirohydrochlorin cobaltochelatase [Mobilisporobacter senegalensis]
MQQGILMVSFGSSHKETREKNIDGIFSHVREKYPKAKCYQAFSSDMIRKILKTRDFIEIPDIEGALIEMKKDGITHAYIQPTHIIDGIENNKMKEIAGKFSGEFQVLKIGSPLLDTKEDFDETVKGIWEELTPIVRDDILILMGHGTTHEANEAYSRLEACFRSHGKNKVYIATVEGTPTIEDVMDKLTCRKGERIVLAPFMFVAGEHAVNDMAGEEDSFSSKLSAAGYITDCILKGIGEYEPIRDRYIKHLDEILTKAE